MTQPAFELNGAAVRLGERFVVEDLDLRIEAGESVAIVGSSGAGKTTLLRVLAGIQPLHQGQVHIAGQDPTQRTGPALRKLRNSLGFVHQDHALVANLRASQNVLSGALGKRSLLGGMRDMLFPKRVDLERAHALLERVGIGDRIFQRTGTLSGGERQRVAIARALFQKPLALLADEPVASLDPEWAEDVARLLCGLAAEEGLTLVASLHDLDLARAFFPRLIALRNGRVLFDGPPQELNGASYREIYGLASAKPEENGA